MKIVEQVHRNAGEPVFICDVSPPRGADPGLLEPLRGLDADFLSMAYNPGRSVRVNSVAAAYWLRRETGADMAFTIATRDMNRVAIQSLLLGAELLGLENVIVVRGDDFTPRELSTVRDVHDFTPTGLIRAIGAMNEGVDHRGLRLRGPTDLCVGATIDLGRGIDSEVRLTHAKAEAGAQFFVSQPTFSAELPLRFLERYASLYGDLTAPVFHGVPVMAPNSLALGEVPQQVTDDLAAGRPGADIAVQLVDDLTDAGLTTFYLVPPILRAGRRDYGAAREVLARFA